VVRKPTLPVAPEVDQPEEEWGRVRIEVTSELFGNIYVDGSFMAGTLDGESIPVSPGGHEVEIRGPRIQQWKQVVEISAGEQLTLPVELISRPSDVVFRQDRWAGDCVVTLDGNRMGTVEQLSRVLEVKRPNQAHSISATCPDGKSLAQSKPYVTPGWEFPVAGEP
jgi:hypothetical protein